MFEKILCHCERRSREAIQKIKNGLLRRCAFRTTPRNDRDLSLLSRNTKYKIKLLIAGLLAVLFCYLIRLNLFSCAMVILYAMIIVQSSIGATLSNLRSLTAWILGGTVIGFLALLLLGAVIAIHPDTIWLVLASFVIAGSFVLPIGQMARLGLFTAIVVVIFGSTSHTPLQTALQRGACLLIAAFIGLAVSYFVFPERASRQLKQSIQDFFDHGLTFYRRISEYYFQPGKTDFTKFDPEKELMQAVKMRERITNFSQLIQFAKQDGIHRSDEYFEMIILVKHRFVTFLLDYIRLMPSVKDSKLLDISRNYLRVLSNAIETIVMIWMDVTEHQSSDRTMPDLNDIYQQIEALLREHRDLLMVVTIDELTRFFAFYNLLKMFADRMVSRIELTRNAF